MIKKINFILDAYGNSGGDQVVNNYSELFNKRGIDTVIYIPLIPYLYEGTFKEKILRIKRFFGHIYHYLIRGEVKKKYGKYRYKIVLLINNIFVRDADVSIATAWPTSFDVVKLNKKKGKKFYFVQDYEIWSNQKLGKKSYELPLKKITISSWIKDMINKQGIKDNIEIVFNGINAEMYDNKKEIINKKEMNCLMLAHNLEKKGCIDGLKAFEMARKKNKNLKLTMFGIQKLKFKTPEYVQFVENPSRNEIINLYAKNDIFIFPSKAEGWGLTVVEAMASKCAVVATNSGCIIDIGENEENCLISRPGDVISLSNNILKLSENYDLRKKISENGYTTVKKLKWEKSVDKFLKILND